MDSVGIHKRKRPAGGLVWRGYVIDEDDAGTWMFTPAGSTCVGADASGSPAWCYVGKPDYPGLDVLHLASHRDWWFAHITGDSGHVAVAIDICTPPMLVGDTWEYDDLELDVLASDGRVLVDDEDEFTDARAQGHITGVEAGQALATTVAVKELLERRASPFDAYLHERFRAALACHLHPLTTTRGADVPFYR